MARDQQKTQKGQQVPNFTEDQARDYFEKLRWSNGPACVHCGSVAVYRLGGEATRAGLLKCRDCKGQFSVTVNTVMEDTHLPLATWAKAFHLMASSKKGVSALQLQRQLGLGSYRTAWHLAHRIRFAMKQDMKLTGQVQVDETYVGGKPRRRHGEPKRFGRGTAKTPVVALVETDGKMHARPIAHVDANSLKAAMHECIDLSAEIVTDEFLAYRPAARAFADHWTVTHSTGQYVNHRGDNTNSAESYFALLKRGLHGSFHYVSKKHLHRYCDEFSFRWNGRKMLDTERRDEAVRGAEGKRLMYRLPVGSA